MSDLPLTYTSSVALRVDWLVGLLGPEVVVSLNVLKCSSDPT